MENEPSGPSYPKRAELIADLCQLLKAARRPLADEWKHSDLDDESWALLGRLAGRLVRHIHFEHLGQDKLSSALHNAVRRYKNSPAGQRPAIKPYAAEILDGLAQEPTRRRCYLGVKHLKLPHGTTVGDARFLELSQDDSLRESFAWLKDKAPELVCEVETAGGTDDHLRDRARKTAERALALVRQQALFGFMAKIYLDQVMFGLDGTYTWYEDAELARAGWWRDPAPIAMNLAEPATAEWRTRLGRLSADYLSLPSGLRGRVDVCLGWLDVAARSDRWPIIIPATFSAMEAILVPERSGLKAGVVTVRSVAVHIAVGNGFLDPGTVMAGYGLRSDLVHGTPTPDVLDDEATEFAESTRRWAFDVFRDYLTFATATQARTVTQIAAQLDNGACNDVGTWLEENGGSAIVEEYRGSVTSPRPENK